jgi:F0F1-type ATP synthase membrane subunit b/b'
MSSFNIYPFLPNDPNTVLRFGVQFGLFIVTVFFVYKKILSPLFLLQQERLKRTQGFSSEAKQLVKQAEANLQHVENTLQASHATYKSNFLQKEQEAKNQLDVIFLESQTDLLQKFNHSKEAVASELASQKPLVTDLANHLYTQILSHKFKQNTQQKGSVLTQYIVSLCSVFALILFVNFVCTTQHVFAANDASANAGYGYNLYWPLVQFAMFLAGVIYWGRKPVRNMLASSRSKLETELSQGKLDLETAKQMFAESQKKQIAMEQTLMDMQQYYVTELELFKQSYKEQIDAKLQGLKAQNDRQISILVQGAKQEITQETLHTLTALLLEKTTTEQWEGK